MTISFTCQDLKELEDTLEYIKKKDSNSFPVKIILDSAQSDPPAQKFQRLRIKPDKKDPTGDGWNEKDHEMSVYKRNNAPLASQIQRTSTTIKKEIDDFFLWWYYDGRDERTEFMKQAAGLNVAVSLKDKKIILEGEKSAVECLFKSITSLHYQKSVDMKWDKADCVRRTSYFEQIKDETKTEDRLYRHFTNNITDTVNLVIYGRFKEKVEYFVEQINFIVEKTAVLLTVPGRNAHKNEIEKIFTFLEVSYIRSIKEQLQIRNIESQYRRFENQIGQNLIFFFINSKEDVTDIFDQLHQEMSCLCFLNILQDENNPFKIEPTPTKNIQKEALNVFDLNDSSYILIGPLNVMRKNLKKLFSKEVFHTQSLRYQFKGKKFDDPEKTKQLARLQFLLFDSQRDKKIKYFYQEYGIYRFRYKGMCGDAENILGKIEEIYRGLIPQIDAETSQNQSTLVFSDTTHNEEIESQDPQEGAIKSNIDKIIPSQLQKDEEASDDKISSSSNG